MLQTSNRESDVRLVGLTISLEAICGRAQKFQV
jgi:hypothetical protein